MKRISKNQIILVDDDANYIALFDRVIATCQPPSILKALASGADLLVWLETRQRPNLIFLDINMPGAWGFDVLRVLKSVETYKAIPVIMLSVSDAQADIARSYDGGASGYIAKPETFEELTSCMQLVIKYWFDIGTTPNGDWTKLNEHTMYN